MLFSDCGVDSNIISWNRLVLLYGPPGTGKTSLCKALAHKLAIRMGHRYTHGQLVEINSHSLFSKYFSEVCTVKLMLTFSLVTHSEKQSTKIIEEQLIYSHSLLNQCCQNTFCGPKTVMGFQLNKAIEN